MQRKIKSIIKNIYKHKRTNGRNGKNSQNIDEIPNLFFVSLEYFTTQHRGMKK